MSSEHSNRVMSMAAIKVRLNVVYGETAARQNGIGTTQVSLALQFSLL
jgi:hypothetical protein